MKNIIYVGILLSILFTESLKAQEKENVAIWKKSVLKESGFREINVNKLESWDLSNIIGNQLRFEDDPFSTYVGAFGLNYQRIDFHLKAKKDKKQGNTYILSGKSRLGKNIRELKGVMTMSNLLLIENSDGLDNVYLGVFDYQLSEPGDRNGDGVFEGVFAIVFFKREGEIQLYWSESGDFRDYNNMFVGKWKRFNSKVERKCIFTFDPVGLYDKLPFCDDLYVFDDDNSDLTFISKKYAKYGWNDSDSKNDYPYKSSWWKN